MHALNHSRSSEIRIFRDDSVPFTAKTRQLVYFRSVILIFVFREKTRDRELLDSSETPCTYIRTYVAGKR